MLQQLSIKNYAIIEELELDFNNDFTVITGETGAGKSILLGALSLILGQRADTSVLNDNTKKCVVEGNFYINKKKFESFFNQNELDFEEQTLIRREISVSGKSRAFINDTPVNLNTIKELTSLLIDIHSQHQTLALNSVDFQLGVVDSFAKIEEIIEYKALYKDYLVLKKQYEVMLKKETEAKNDIEYIKFQINELTTLSIKPNEQEDLEQQLELIKNVEQIVSSLELSTYHLVNEESNIIYNLSTISNSFSKISHCSQNYLQLNERINSVLIELKDIANEIENELQTIDVDVSKTDFINNRLNSLYTIAQKHRVSSANELIPIQQGLEEQLLSINLGNDRLKELQEKIEHLEKELVELATKISSKRVAAFGKLATTISSNLAELGMKDALFKIEHNTTNLTENGIDGIEFLFSANKGFEPKLLQKTASGGELSRLMLTIKSILALNTAISTIIFDEIDTGVSGDIAHKMASIMQQMSKKIQIIAITHLPQVAVKGNTHFKIYKENKQGKTLTLVKKIAGEDRINEIAKMLSGKELTQAAKDNAKNLLSID